MSTERDYAPHFFTALGVCLVLLIALVAVSAKASQLAAGDGLHPVGQETVADFYHVTQKGKYRNQVVPAEAAFGKGTPKGRFFRETCNVEADGDVDEVTVRKAVTTCIITDITRAEALAKIVAGMAQAPSPGRPADVS